MEEQVARLVPLVGCDLEGVEGLRVQARGDFPATQSSQIPVATPGSRLRALPDEVAGITVEGLFGPDVGAAVVAVGRTARLQGEGDVPVYFAPPEQLCPVTLGEPGRSVAALAVTPAGHALAVGGRSPSGVPVPDLVHVRDVDGEVTVLDTALPVPAVGHTAHAVDEHTVVVIGGAGSSHAAFASVLRIDLDDPPQRARVSDPIPVEVDGRDEPGRAFHASTMLDDGRIVVVGGCAGVRDGTCIPAADSVLGTGFVINLDGDGERFTSMPDLSVPRYEHELLHAADEVLFAVGGRGLDAEPVGIIEVYLPQSGRWAPYGPSLLDVLDGGEVVTGATLLEGGLIVLVLDNGEVWWLDQNNLGRLEQWCEGDAFCFSRPGPGVATRRHPLTLPGERVVIDNFVLPVALLGLNGRDVLNLSEPQAGQTTTPPGPRLGTQTVLLADGSVLQAGGVNPVSGVAQDPLFLRLRPPLDGPDESIPDVANLDPGSLVVHDTTTEEPRLTLSAGTLVLEPDPVLPIDFLATWAHVRGFRSQRFRLEVTLEAIREARPRLVFSRGAIARVVVQFDEQVKLSRREADAQGLVIACEGARLDFAGVAKSIQVDVAVDRITIRSGDDQVTCPGIGEGAVAVGLGAAGDGTVRASGWRLSRN